MSTFRRQASFHCGSTFLRPKGLTSGALGIYKDISYLFRVERERTDGIAHAFLQRSMCTCVQGGKAAIPRGVGVHGAVLMC